LEWAAAAAAAEEGVCSTWLESEE
jgi:hypothetical protein